MGHCPNNKVYHQDKIQEFELYSVRKDFTSLFLTSEELESVG